ncbi:DUF4249 domain-containing protein [Algoriphagus sp. A40]|uniref:DUF4249 domain-containing protein n=1 Tax=Algoriphagus sp. A40 TaxID=1945863 RepID=UPI000986AC4D|nr:DUF4249 domain-containing protein [Algoriphagus sp. A40]OOG74373.1 hypothetical protein B0E43_12110 [Algoriphagus sp. A40]
MLRRLIHILLLIPIACIDPYEVEVPEGKELLSVDGLIHTGQGPHAITISRSTTYGSQFEGLIRPVSGATVVVRDNEGMVTFLEEGQEARGSYFTPTGFRAQVGKSYTLQIQTTEGRVYTSLPERVNAVPEIEAITMKTVTVPVEGETNPRSGIQLISEINDPADQNNFYFWRSGRATYLQETYPELYIIRPAKIPAPKACCNFCYITEPGSNQSLFIAQDDSFNGLSTRIPAAFIKDDGRRFIFKYRMELRQYSISQEAYRFLRLIKQQAEISGSIFDPPPATIRGNIISLDNPDEEVLGYFIAAGETTKEIYIDRAELSFRQNKVTIPDDCLTLPGASLIPPVDWKP